MTAARDDDFMALPGMEADSTDTRDQVYTGVATWIEDFYNPRASTPASAANPPSNTNYTKRPGQQPHKQTVNNLRTGPVPGPQAG